MPVPQLPPFQFPPLAKFGPNAPFDVSLPPVGIPAALASSGRGIPITVTSLATANSSNGGNLRVFVLNGAQAAALQAAGARWLQSASGAHQATASTTVPGSRIYGAVLSGSPGALVQDAGTQVVDAVPDTGHTKQYISVKSGYTSQPGSVTFGYSAPSDNGGLAAAEILPTPGNSVTEDSSSPPAVGGTGAITFTTAQFIPPAGSVLVALVSFNGTSATVVTAQVTDSLGRTWTPLVQANASNMKYAGVFVIDAPQLSAPVPRLPPFQFPPLAGAFGPNAPFDLLLIGQGSGAQPVQSAGPAAIVQGVAPFMTAPLSQAFGPWPPFSVPEVAPQALTAVLISGIASMGVAAAMTAPGTLLDPTTGMAVSTTLSAPGDLSAPVTMAVATGLTVVEDLSAPVTLIVATSLTEVELLSAVATMAAGTVLTEIELLSAIAAMAAGLSLSAPSVLLSPVTLAAATSLSAVALQAATTLMAAGTSLTMTEVQGVVATMAAQSGLTSLGDQLATVSMGAGSALTPLELLSDPVTMAVALGLSSGAQQGSVTMGAASVLTEGGALGSPVSMGAAAALTLASALNDVLSMAVAGSLSPSSTLRVAMALVVQAQLTATGQVITRGHGVDLLMATFP